MNKTVIILGSSRSDGDTYKMVAYLKQQKNIPIIDLKTKNIGEFDYEFNNKEDDFLPLIRSILQEYDTIVFATPVYWYSMSGIMKTFFDRISDLLFIEKDTGRKFRGKKMAVLSCGGGDDLNPHFHMPFIESANYLGMEYLGDVHTWMEGDNVLNKEVVDRLDKFCKVL